MSNSRHRHGPRSLVADRYYILTEIGTGGMGTVYRGRDRHTGRAVAIKLLHPHLRRDPVYVARFRREADLATRLDSRHIVQVLDYGVDDGEPYIVMEFIEGQTLAELLLQGPLSQAGAAHVGVQIARALEEAHDKGVIHRDIKPRNVLIQPDGAIKVADFGIARSEDSDTGTQTNEIGAAAYMAPERFSPGRFGLVDARTDVYSLGVVLYEMLAGYPPFSGDTYELLHAILEEQPQPIEELRPELEPAVTELIGACLAKQTADRPATAAEVRLTLQPLADASQLNRPRPSGLKRLLLLPLLPFALMRGKPTRSRDYRRTAARGTRSRPAIVLVGVAALVTVAAVVLGFVLLSRSGDKSPQQAQLLAPTAAAAVTAAAVSPTPASCIEGNASPIGQALTRCPTARTAYIPSCPLGQACASTTDATGTQVLAVNDATIALVDNSGALIIARPDGSVVQHLSNRGQVQQPAWSPDGRYLAYVSSQQLPASDQTPGTFYATQLRIVEPQNAGNDWVVVASTQEPGTDEAYRRLISWPHWSADGKSLLFLWDAGTADGIFQVDLPFQDRGLDPSRLVKEPPSGNFYAVSPLRRLSLTADAFGYPAGYIGEFATATDGRLFVQFCDSKVGPRQCGLGQWDGRQAKVVVPFPKESFVLDQPALLPGTDDLYAYVRSLSNTDQLLHVNVASGQTNKVSDVARDLTLSPFLPTIGIANDGKTLLVATGAKPDALASLSLSDGQTKPWGPGYAPSWFVPVTTTDAPKTLPSDVWTAPTPTPSPTPVPVRRALPMTVSIDVRRAGSTLASAQVVALVDGQECANGTTDASGHLLLTVPSDDAAAACFKPGATVTFRVNGTQVPNQVTFTSQAAAQAPISLP